MALESVTVEFSPQEDRLLLRVQYDGTGETQFHWTRRLVRLMWPVFVKLAKGRRRSRPSRSPRSARRWSR